jgi:DNA-directed RNA polymerase subunit RPC12/RpoP
MTERIVTKEMACNEAGTHDPFDDSNDYTCRACGSSSNAPTNAWKCGDCGNVVERYRGEGDVRCNCGANYNASGQRLRDDYRGNPSMWDDEIGDMEGYEMQHAGDW